MKLLFAGLAATIVMLSIIAFFHVVKINKTNSLPKGVYIRTFGEIKHGSIVWMPMPDVIMSVYLKDRSDAKRYFSRRENGILKPVIALPGEQFCPHGDDCFTVHQGEFAVYSDYVEDSIDSRYFGAARDAVGPYKLIISE